ncbi:unnamed protein product [Albugo candida]|uniref:Uncharacterized protein n=1 Tax=Albugo candida TaxID=65357 RepID=A0A024FWT8_9STRA|nr:unnamed protein product [Albugo candida]|eukprot:CCI11648.1 unnamed protein product [Albugo candida]
MKREDLLSLPTFISKSSVDAFFAKYNFALASCWRKMNKMQQVEDMDGCAIPI